MKITVVDYGIGNLHSVCRALEHVGAEPVLGSDAASLAGAERILLPGVGAFADGMAGLRERGLVGALRKHASEGRPLLGICLGMQMLATASEEFGVHDGLDLIAGRVVPVNAAARSGHRLKIPHIGWSELQPPSGRTWHGTLLCDTAPGTPMYLVHSYHLQPAQPGDLLAVCQYGEHEVVTAVRRGQVYGLQFHPEKSGQDGLDVLTRFVRL